MHPLRRWLILKVDQRKLVRKGKVGLTVIEEEARECVWRELIINRKGFTTTFKDRDVKGSAEDQYAFTLEQMQKIQDELARVRDKYSSGDWEK